MTFSEMYNFGIGELGLMPDEFFALTSAEFSAKIRGYVINRDLDSANHRNLFTLTANLNRKKGASAKSPEELWGLAIDEENKVSIDERLEFYKKIGNNERNK